MSINKAEFPSILKLAEVCPIFKKDDRLDKRNYRPVSVLPCISKIFEGIIVDQLSLYFEQLFSPFLSGFRKSHSCQSVLLRYIDDCKLVLDKNLLSGSILTDLSKAFDSLPHGLLVSKLKPYGLDATCCVLVANYFIGRKQRVKVGNDISTWMTVTKGTAQGSMFGPFMYNIFSNDLLMSLHNKCKIYNYADDNTWSCHGDNVTEVLHQL